MSAVNSSPNDLVESGYCKAIQAKDSGIEPKQKALIPITASGSDDEDEPEYVLGTCTEKSSGGRCYEFKVDATGREIDVMGWEDIYKVDVGTTLGDGKQSFFVEVDDDASSCFTVYVNFGGASKYTKVLESKSTVSGRFVYKIGVKDDGADQLVSSSSRVYVPFDDKLSQSDDDEDTDDNEDKDDDVDTDDDDMAANNKNGIKKKNKVKSNPTETLIKESVNKIYLVTESGIFDSVYVEKGMFVQAQGPSNRYPQAPSASGGNQGGIMVKEYDAEGGKSVKNVFAVNYSSLQFVTEGWDPVRKPDQIRSGGKGKKAKKKQGAVLSSGPVIKARNGKVISVGGPPDMKKAAAESKKKRKAASKKVSSLDDDSVISENDLKKAAAASKKKRKPASKKVSSLDDDSVISERSEADSDKDTAVVSHQKTNISHSSWFDQSTSLGAGVASEREEVSYDELCRSIPNKSWKPFGDTKWEYALEGTTTSDGSNKTSCTYYKCGVLQLGKETPPDASQIELAREQTEAASQVVHKSMLERKKLAEMENSEAASREHEKTTGFKSWFGSSTRHTSTSEDSGTNTTGKGWWQNWFGKTPVEEGKTPVEEYTESVLVVAAEKLVDDNTTPNTPTNIRRQVRAGNPDYISVLEDLAGKVVPQDGYKALAKVHKAEEERS